MNILLESTINKEVQEHYRKLDAIQTHINEAYINEETEDRVTYEKNLADLLKNINKITKYIKKH